ncbi:FKBP-type peptidyl-prolyl cis-trans isomerase [Thioflexithrix psekupsensis]|uniref:Peptidyl-prolyl cis-trans isomerase n=1 Tax=Thioflexithrix psekupsensis TaxID=1570016 RepID=A0A251X400_9GAMM|nr:FKBP-type peptidyl-prolyl cis-trans isomerase [Thioflexithrix psekupsensis]OUD12181.1 peptidylprolyl isomerase [Thioflexithrix psekupsensis]
MKKYVSLLSVPVLLCSSLAFADLAKPESDVDKLSYSFGQNVGKSLQHQETELNMDYIFQGIRDALGNQAGLLSDEEIQQVLLSYQQDKIAKQEEAHRKQAEENKAKGDAFLAENAKKEGVVTLPSGLQYKEVTAGTGKTPSKDDQVTVHYRGTLINGEEFDSSHKRGEPITFPVSGVIAGWTEALQLMKEGAKWQLFIPSELAYGSRGTGGVIGPDETLIFDVELISVAKP